MRPGEKDSSNSESATPAGRSPALRPARESDLESLRQLLQDLALPTLGLDQWWRHFIVAEAGGAIVAVAGLELYQDGALLRSVAVRPEWRGAGLGRLIVDRALAEADRAGRGDVYLLTTTAERYFPRLGFIVVPRASVPETVQASVEFREACPSSAVVMHRRLRPAGHSDPSTGGRSHS